MDLGLGNTLLAGDPRLVDHIVGEVKSQGIFDQFRKDCIADVDTKPAYQNLRTRVESSVNSFLGKQVWRADLNKNQLRETLRKHIHEAPYLDAGVERIVDQVVNPKVYSVFMPQIEEVVYKFLGLERPRARERNGGGFKDLLPKDLDPVSPESDKNSLKDVSLDSVDAQMGIGGDGGSLGEENDLKNPTSGNGVLESSEKAFNEVAKVSGEPGSSAGTLDTSGKSEDKAEEEEEDSPVFEPIDIMNLNESNISNDSHLSGISELTSHRSRSPDFSNETSRDNMDFSNQDSQFSKVSSDSRLSIVTDFGLSNHASGPETPKDERDKNETKFGKDNFRAVRDFDGSKVKEGRLSYDGPAGRDDAKSGKRSSSSKETSRDGTETSKEAGESKDKPRDEISRPKNAKEAKKLEKEPKKKSSDGKSDKVKKVKEKSESSRDTGNKESSAKPKDEKPKDVEKKENSLGKEVKDLKDIYKEKIRELREKKELTEKEKLSKDTKSPKETKEKRDSSREAKKDTKDSRSASSKGHSSRSERKQSRSEGKSSRSESRSSKRDDRKSLKDSRSKSQGGSDSSEKADARRSSKSEKDEKSDKSDLKADSKSKSFGKSSKNDSNKNNDSKRDAKSELEARDKKRRDDKKSKVKDDHSSARKNSDDRRSTDRDGSNGSNGKTSQKNNFTSTTTVNKSVASSLSKESTTTSNSSSETSDSIEERPNEKSVINIEPKSSKLTKIQADTANDPSVQRLDVGSAEISLPIKKRPLNHENPPSSSDISIKKPKFAKNFQEAKKLMKIRRRMERDKLKKQVEPEVEIKSRETSQIVAPPKKVVEDDLKLVPDEERVQIIEVRDEEYDEPYPEVRSDFTLEERSQIILGGESIFTSDFLAQRFNSKSTLSEMELSIRQSLKEMICDNLDESKDAPKNSLETDAGRKTQESVDDSSNPVDIETTIFGNSSLCSEIAENVKISRISEANELKDEICPKNEKTTGDSQKTEDSQVFEKNNAPETNSDLKVLEEKFRADENVEETCEFRGIVAEMAKMEGNSKKSEISEKSFIEKPKFDETIEMARNIEIIQDQDKNLESNPQPNENVEKKPKIDDEQIKTAGISKEESKNAGNSTTETNENEKVEENQKTIATAVAETKSDENSETRSESTENLKEETAETSGNLEDRTEKSKMLEHEEKVDEGDPEMVDEEQKNFPVTSPKMKESKEESKTEEIFENPKMEESFEQQWLEDEESDTCNKQQKEEEEKSFSLSDDEAPCLYFVENTEKLDKFRKFLKTLEHEENPGEDYISETSGTEIVCPMSKAMAPPKPKRKYSTSPLTDILLNNANNNNDALKPIELISDHEDTTNTMKKRKIGRPKKTKINANLCTQQNLSNGENFVMPLSPESDVSATSEKTPSNPLKDEKSRPRGSNQRYTSDDLYKPRPLFSSSSRRSRRSNQA